jgi:hypothetical protein
MAGKTLRMTEHWMVGWQAGVSEQRHYAQALQEKIAYPPSLAERAMEGLYPRPWPRIQKRRPGVAGRRYGQKSEAGWLRTAPSRRAGCANGTCRCRC